MMSQCGGILLSVFVLCNIVSEGARGPLVPIQWYTHPDGLEEVNGSHGSASCGALNTAHDPPRCASGQLTDGVLPQPEDMTTTSWARGFLTVNRGNSTTIEIGFRLERSVVIEEVQLSLLICPAWGIGAPNITLYGAQGTDRTSQLGSITVADDTSCTVQNLTISFNETFRNYLLVFNYETDLNITWLYLGEVQFFELLQTPLITSFSSPLPTSLSPSSTSVGSPSPAPPSIPSRITQGPSSTSSPRMTQEPSPGNKARSNENCEDISSGALVASVTVISLTVLLSVVAHIALCVYQMRSRRRKRVTETMAAVTQEADYDYIDQTLGQGVTEGRAGDLEMKVNSAYGEVQLTAAEVGVQHNEAYKQVCIGPLSKTS